MPRTPVSFPPITSEYRDIHPMPSPFKDNFAQAGISGKPDQEIHIPQALGEKISQLMKALEEKSKREAEWPLSKKIKELFIKYPWGRFKGGLLGIKNIVQKLIDPKSTFYKVNPKNVLDDLSQLDEKAFEFIMDHTQGDYEKRGILESQAQYEIAFWGLSTYFSMGGILKKAVKIFT